MLLLSGYTCRRPRHAEHLLLACRRTQCQLRFRDDQSRQSLAVRLVWLSSMQLTYRSAVLFNVLKFPSGLDCARSL